MTDITGFGLLGHLTEMAEGSEVSAEIFYNQIPVLEGAKEYMAQKVIPGATKRNWNSISDKVEISTDIDSTKVQNLLSDPQTNGGLLIAVSEDTVEEVEKLFIENGYEAFTKPIGRMVSRAEKVVTVRA
jgi:selenide, water dikinase